VKSNILLVEDNPVTTKLVRFALERCNYEVFTAGTGKLALGILENTRIDLVVQDVILPDVDGLEFANVLRSRLRARHVPILAFTGLLSEQEKSRLDQAGFDDVIVKPIEPSRLVRIVGAYLDADAIDHDYGREQVDVSGAGAGVSGEQAASAVKMLPAPNEVLPAVKTSQGLRRRIQRFAGDSELSQRCAILTSQLSVITGISSALSRNEDFDASLENVLASFFDAGGISTGALLLFEPERTDVRAFGRAVRWGKDELGNFFGELDELRSALQKVEQLLLPSSHGELAQAWAVMEAAGLLGALIVPIRSGTELLGALLMSTDGTPIAAEVRASFAIAVATQIAQGLVLARAFAAKSVAEQDAQTNATTLRAMMESIPDGVIVADATGKFVFWNSAADPVRRSHGSQAAAVQDDWPSQYGLFLVDGVTRVPTDDLPLIRAIRGETVENFEIIMRYAESPAGIRVSANARPLMLAGERRGGVVIFRDVTVERAAQEQLMVSDRMASIGTLAAGVAHEINNPLTAVVANLGLALSQTSELESEAGFSPQFAELRECLEEARDASNRVRYIVKDLKLFSRSEEDQRGPISVEQVMESTLRMAENEIRHRARVVRDYRDVPFVDANEARLGQVFLNLVINAAQALPEGNANANEVRVGTSVDAQGRVVVEVHDTGSGIAPEVLEKVFRPFFTTKPAGVGTGLGLAICQRIVTSFGGEISVRSQVGLGTTFSVSLPASQGMAPAKVEAPKIELASRRGKVLVVDDDQSIGTVVRRILSSDHDVRLLTRAEDALACIIAGDRFDIILCDVMMPVVTGMEFYRRLMLEVPEQAERVVFVTGGAFTARARLFMDEVPNGRLEKPFDGATLRAFVNERIH
jgi:signal transduction histidine kinase/DNA-binding response OmpR family regulator